MYTDTACTEGSVNLYRTRSGNCHRNTTRGKRINTIYQQLGYLVRGGDPDAIDSIVPMAYGNLALDLILERHSRQACCVEERAV